MSHLLGLLLNTIKKNESRALGGPIECLLNKGAVFLQHSHLASRTFPVNSLIAPATKKAQFVRNPCR